MNLILIGIQGSGKGTQAKQLVKKFDMKHITTGEIFRKHISQRTDLGMKAQEYMNKGELVPDKFVFNIIEGTLNEANGNFILDGFPRNITQTEFLLNEFKIDAVILLDLKDEKAIERLMARRHCENCGKDYNVLFKPPKQNGICDECGGKLVTRKDDNKEAITKRIEKYHAETNEVVKYFAEKNLLLKVDADQTPKAIHEDIIAKLKK